MSNLLILGSTSGTVRTDQRDGKTYTVVPIVALVEGVIHAMNAKGPELVRTDTFSPTPPLWNGRPVFLGHPLNEQGRPVSGAIPHVAKRSIGMVYNCGVKDDKLCMEAWLDERAPKELLDRVNSGEAVEVSVGVFVDTDTTSGEHAGRAYSGEWHNMVPDHLAILPAGDIGACSWAAGCGVRAASLRLEDAIGNGNNQYTVVNEHTGVVHSSEHATKASAEKAATSAAKRSGYTHSVNKSEGTDKSGNEMLTPISDHHPDGRVSRLNAGAARAAIGNGNNQYTHGQVAAAHEAARTAHETAQEAHKENAKNPSPASRQTAENATAAAMTASSKAEKIARQSGKHGTEDQSAYKSAQYTSQHVNEGNHENNSKQAAQLHQLTASKHGDAAYYHNYQHNYDRGRNNSEGGTDEMVEKKGLTARIFETLREVFRTNDTSDSEVRADLNEMLREQGANGDVVDVYAGYFVYCLYTPTGMTYYRRDYTQDATGAVAGIGTDVTEVEPKRSYEPVAASTTQPEPTAACGCHQQKEKDLMDLKTRVKALITASKGVYEDTDATMLEGYKPERLTALEAKFAEAAPVVPKVEMPAAAAAVPAAAPAAKEPTFDELLAKADPDTRAAIESGRTAAAAKKTATIATLKASKRCDYTDEQLTAMSQVDLDRLAKLASVTVATGTVDYSGQGAPRQGGQHQGAPAPIELKDALAAKNTK